jgi:hypothetical protein
MQAVDLTAACLQPKNQVLPFNYSLQINNLDVMEDYLEKCRRIITVVEQQSEQIRTAAGWFAETILAGLYQAVGAVAPLVS